MLTGEKSESLSAGVYNGVLILLKNGVPEAFAIKTLNQLFSRLIAIMLFASKVGNSLFNKMLAEVPT